MNSKLQRRLKKEIVVHDFQGKRFRIEWRKPTKRESKDFKLGKDIVLMGYTEVDINNLTNRDKRIVVDPNVSELDLLHSCIDEAIHAVDFNLDNGEVYALSENVAKFLWRIGFRLQKEQ